MYVESFKLSHMFVMGTIGDKLGELFGDLCLSGVIY